MAKQVTKDMLIGELVQVDPGIVSNPDGCRNALHRLPFRTGRISG